MPYILSLTPAGVSVRQGIHYIQQVRDGSFRKFDYDDVKINQEKYGSDKPPEYDLSQVKIPVNIIGSADDRTANLNNIRRLMTKLPNLKITEIVKFDNFEHNDFLYSRYVRMAVNDALLQRINIANEME